jgi:hypothetical protein
VRRGLSLTLTLFLGWVLLDAILSIAPRPTVFYT